VIVPGLGRFTAKRKPARRFFNPATGEVEIVPPRDVVTCKVTQHLMTRVFDGDA
jgi:nucleoid DNA-binding protein